jgi:transposase InsO family protein
MPWREATAVSERYEFVTLAMADGANIAELCRRFGISRSKGYKWLGRFKACGRAGLLDRSRRPKASPKQTALVMEEAVTGLRLKHPAWGGRKIKRRLEDLGHTAIPAASTVTGILRRRGLIDPAESQKRVPFLRFEHEQPNELLQMDFKGHFPLQEGRCHPLTLLDDHSRFCLLAEACPDEKGETVKAGLTKAFRRYGLPARMTMDNGSPWGSDREHTVTPLTVWLMRLEIRVSHSRPYHPQTQGKNERFNGTLAREVIARASFASLDEAQATFEDWREVYNLERPHEALGLKTPASRYRPSPRPFPEMLPPVAYTEGTIIRKVQDRGWISFKGCDIKLPKALKGFPVSIEPRIAEDGVFDVRFCKTRLRSFDLNLPANGNHV